MATVRIAVAGATSVGAGNSTQSVARPRTLTNYPVHGVSVTITVDDKSCKVDLTNENEVRNFLGRLAPASAIRSHQDKILGVLDDSLNEVFDFCLNEAKEGGLDLPEGI